MCPRVPEQILARKSGIAKEATAPSRKRLGRGDRKTPGRRVVTA